jgi:hypothetical protein
MTARSSLPPTGVSGSAVLEIDRFEWVTPDRIEIVGTWTGLRGRRFIRPTLILKGEGDPKRLLAVLDHKPWAAEHGEEWIAAFPWRGDPVGFESATLHVASGIDVELPPPQVEPGKEPRFARPAPGGPAAAEAAAVPVPPAEVEPEGDHTGAPLASAAVEPEIDDADGPAASAAVEPAIGGFRLESEPEGPPGPTAPDPVAVVRGELDAAHADIERLRAEREADIDRLRGERDGFRRERDAALEQLRKVRGEFERERQTHERALADARAHERGATTKMLAEGAAMRAALERQREIAYHERDNAKEARDEAIAACNEALDARDEADEARKQAEHDRKDAFAERDRAIKARQKAEDERRKAVEVQAEAQAERDKALKERDEILRVHERGLPIHPPKPRFLPEDHERRSQTEVWAPRAAAIGLLLVIAFIVLRLAAGG